MLGGVGFGSGMTGKLRRAWHWCMVLVPGGVWLTEMEILFFLLGDSLKRACVNVHVVNTFLFFLEVRGNFCVLHVPNLLVGDVYHV